MKKVLKSLLFFLIVLSVSSCEKPAGEGGTSTILGQVKVKNYNSDFTVKFGEYYAPDRDVFIIYGEDTIYSNDFKTGLNGWYRFDFLNQGTYTIFTFSDDSTKRDPSNMIPVSTTVTIDENKEVFIADELVIFDTSKGGTSTIMGQVRVKNYNSDFTIKTGEYYGPDRDVFIIYGEDSIYTDDFKTGLNGWYRFESLGQGTYTIYTFSEDSTRRDPSNMIPVYTTVVVNEDNELFIADELVIFD